MSEPKIVSLHGGPIDAPEAIPAVVERLEQLLEQAKSGDITGMIYALNNGGVATTMGWVGLSASTTMVGALARLQNRVAADLEAKADA